MPAPDRIQGGGRSLAWQSPASESPFGRAPLPGAAGYGPGLGQLGFDPTHAATLQAVQVGAFRAPGALPAGGGGPVAELI